MVQGGRVSAAARAGFADLVSPDVLAAYRDGNERLAATLLHRARQRQRPGTAEWAILERLEGLLWIAVQREVEGTFALDRADRLLDALAVRYPALGYPGLEWLDPDDDRTGGAAEGAG
ncbi:hypothetical protein GCM10008939_16780 [Deinococcus aquiradiocola]|uniref:Uncharacterized protein n=1 Tax=Deinococcus aquiradiocola TaxID=393059 RepID=A0A917PED1_9DEIO|nr:hypothetical protein GCM10008939_16780 [Deinococcus aquiradiocola]